MKPMRFFLILTNGESMIPLAQIGKSSSAPPRQDAPMVFQDVVLLRPLTLKVVEEAVPPSLTSSRRFLGEPARGLCGPRLERGICAGALGTISSSPLR